MKIKTKFRIIMILIISMTILVSAIFWGTLRIVNNIGAKRDHAFKISKEIYELSVLSYDYFLHHKEEIISRWEEEYEFTQVVIDKADFDRPEEQKLIREIRKQLEEVKKYFDDLIILHEKSNYDQGTASMTRNIEGGMGGKIQALTSSAFFMLQRKYQDAVDIQYKANILIVVLITVFPVLGAFFVYMLGGSLARPIRKLVEGVQIIGKGDLDHKLGSSSKDEIGQLSQAFDKMTENLKKITASRDDLNREIADRKKAERELQETLEELERSNENLEQFAYVASHDLQEPLRMVAGYVQLLERRYRGKLDEDAEEFIDFAVGGVDRMRCLINDLLAYSRIGTKGRPFEIVDCENAVNTALENLKVAIKESDSVISYDPLPSVEADESQLIQLFQNLIGNAIKFCDKKNPEVKISSKRQGDKWVFSVHDNGKGIDQQYFERIFVIFQCLHSRDEYPGTGIGLAICKKIVERHGGSIWVKSKIGKESTFYFALPDKAG